MITLLKLALDKGYSTFGVWDVLNNKANEESKLIEMILIQKWLREKKQIYVDVVTDCTCEPKYCYYIYEFVGNPNCLSAEEWYWKDDTHTKYDFGLDYTYEKSLYNGLIDALKLL